MPQISTRTKLEASRLFKQLKPISQERWCNYLVDRDFLAARISPEQRKVIIEGAVASGRKLAQQLRKKYGELTAEQLAYQLHCTVTHADAQNVQKQIFLATFTEPTQIKLYDEPLDKLAALAIEELPAEQILQIVLAHELFHYFEGQNEQLFSQQNKIELWHFLNYHHQTTIRSASEIAAMSFSWELNQLAYSPLVIDLLTLHCYNATAAKESVAQLVAGASVGADK